VSGAATVAAPVFFPDVMSNYRFFSRCRALPFADLGVDSTRPAHVAGYSTRSKIINHRPARKHIMNNGTIENPTNRLPRVIDLSDELTKLKKELLQAEVRLAKARATVTGAEVDIKVLNARLKALAK
jgi:hypothetical protein